MLNGILALYRLLQRREEELRQRRQHVEHLIRWHKRLDDEEQAVLDMERKLMAQTNEARRNQPEPDSIRRKQIANIEHSIEVLQSMSGRRSSRSDDEDRVNVSGSKLNRLWRRLTGDSAQKFEPTRRYVLTKPDIEGLYEEAKLVVIGQFAEGPKVLDQTMNSSITDIKVAKIVSSERIQSVDDEFIVVPALNMDFTSTEELSSITTDAEGSASAAGYYFSDYTPSNQRNEELASIEKIQSPNVSKSQETKELSPKSYVSKTKNEFSDTATTVDDLSVLKESFLVQEDTTAKPTRLAENTYAKHLTADDLPNETFIGDVSCPPFEITESSNQDVDSISLIANHTDKEDQQSDNSPITQLDNPDTWSSSDKPVLVVSAEVDEIPHIDDSETKNSSVLEEIETQDNSSISENVQSLTEYLDESQPDSGREVSIVSEAIQKTSATDSTGTFDNESESNHTESSSTVVEPLELPVALEAAPRDYVTSVVADKNPSKMPDIISEAEVLRRQQIEIEQEVRVLFFTPCILHC